MQPENNPTKNSRALAFLLILLLVLVGGYFLINKDSDKSNDVVTEEVPPLVERDDRGIPVYNASCEGRSYTCADFSEKKDAQDVYNTCYTVEEPDRHSLDSDGNGIACDE